MCAILRAGRQPVHDRRPASGIVTALDRGVLGTLTTVAPLLERVGAQLPPPVSVIVNALGVSVHPWLPGAPVSALLAWAEQLSHVTYTAGPVADFEITEITARGDLDGIAIQVIAYTAAPGDTRSHAAVSEAVLRRLAAAENPIHLPETTT